MVKTKHHGPSIPMHLDDLKNHKEVHMDHPIKVTCGKIILFRKFLSSGEWGDKPEMGRLTTGCGMKRVKFRIPKAKRPGGPVGAT